MLITEEMIGKAVEELNTAMLCSLPTSAPHHFSAGFERKMKRIIRRGNHPVLYRSVRQAASFALVILLSLLLVCAVSPEARAAVFGWVKEQFDLYSNYYFSGEADSIAPESYELGFIPDGYTEFSRFAADGFTSIYYSNTDNAILQFSYTNSPESDSLSMSHPNHTHISATVNGQYADIYLSITQEYPNELIWEDHDRLFYVYGYFSEAELIQIAESVH